MAIGQLRFLYVGTEDTDASVAHYTNVLGARLRWRFQHFGADVAAIELSTDPSSAGDDDPTGPLLLLADHRPTGSVLPIYAVDDLAAVIERARAAGASVDEPEETPEGPVVILLDPAGAEVAFIRVDRPGAMDLAWTDSTNQQRVI